MADALQRGRHDARPEEPPADETFRSELAAAISEVCGRDDVWRVSIEEYRGALKGFGLDAGMLGSSPKATWSIRISVHSLMSTVTAH